MNGGRDTLTAPAQRSALHVRAVLLLARGRGTPRAAGVMMLGFVLSAVFGSVRQVLLNAQLGAGSEASAFYAALVVPGIITSILLGGAVSNALIPVMAQVEREDGQAASQEVASAVATTLTALIVGIVLVAEVLAPVIVVNVLAPGFDPATADLTVALLRLLLLQPLPMAMAAVAGSLLVSRDRFLWPALALSSVNIMTIGGALLAVAQPEIGVYGPAAGVLAGAVLNALLLVGQIRSIGLRLRPVWRDQRRHLAEVAGLFVPNSVLLAVLHMGDILDTSFASRAAEAAAVPALHNAWMLIGLPAAVLGQAIGQAIFPRLAAHAAACEWSAMRTGMLRTVGAAVGLGLLIQIGLLLFSRQVITVLFEHGRFDQATGSLTNVILLTYALALPSFATNDLLMRLFFALRDTRTPILSKVANLTLRMLLVSAFIRELGVVAIPIATASAATMEAAALAVIAWRTLDRRVKDAEEQVPPESLLC